MQGLQDNPGFAHRLTRLRIQAANGVHPAQGEQDRFPGLIGRGAAAHAAVAALRHNRHAVFRA